MYMDLNRDILFYSMELWFLLELDWDFFLISYFYLIPIRNLYWHFFHSVLFVIQWLWVIIFAVVVDVDDEIIGF